MDELSLADQVVRQIVKDLQTRVREQASMIEFLQAHQCQCEKNKQYAPIDARSQDYHNQFKP